MRAGGTAKEGGRNSAHPDCPSIGVGLPLVSHKIEGSITGSLSTLK